MLLDRATKTLIAITTLLASLFLVINLIVERAPVEDWALAGILAVLSVGFWVWIWLEDQDNKDESALALSTAPVESMPQEWIISKESVPEVDVESVIPPELTTEVEISDVDEPDVRAFEETATARTMDTSRGETVVGDAASVTEVQKPVEDTAVGEVDVPEPEKGETKTPEATVEEIIESNGDDDPPVVEDAKAEEPVAESAVAEAMSAPPAEAPEATDEPDDLTKVEGIGPKYSEALIDGGITTFSELAAASMEQLEQIIADADMRRPASIETWAEQAGLAAKGDWDGLAALQDELDGGRRT